MTINTTSSEYYGANGAERNALPDLVINGLLLFTYIRDWRFSAITLQKGKYLTT